MKFHTVVVPSASSAAASSNVHLASLAKEFAELRKQKGRVYQSYVSDGSKQFTFVTTSKDIHLGLGLLSLEGLHHLALLLEQEFARKKFGQLLLRIEKDNGDENSTILVATTSDHGETSFGLSPAR